MNTYRVFVTRHFIAVQFYDVEAENEKDARKVARKAAETLEPDVRDEAADNGWRADDPTEISHIGSAVSDMDMIHVFEDKKGHAWKYKEARA